MIEKKAPLVVREATVEDAPAISRIGSVAFPAVHDDIAGKEFSAAVVAQTYSIPALVASISHCAATDSARFIVAERGGDVIGYLHYDCEGREPELHRIYVDPGQKGGGIGTALMHDLHEWLPPGSTYVLLVAEANVDAQGFYARHGLTLEGCVDGNAHYGNAMSIQVDEAPQEAPALLLRFTKPIQ